MKIRVEVSEGSLFDSSDSEILKITDLQESHKLYNKLVENAVQAMYTKADVEVVISINDCIIIIIEDGEKELEEDVSDEVAIIEGNIFVDFDTWIVYNKEAIEKKFNCKFHWDNSECTWCLSGTDAGNAWETDNYPSGNEREALADALEYLEEYT